MYALIASDWGTWVVYGRLQGVLVGRYSLSELLAIAQQQHGQIFLLWLRA